MDSAADTELEGPLGHPNGCLSGQMSLRVYREVNKNPIVALFTSSAGHCLAVFPDRRRHHRGHRQGLGAAVTGRQRPAGPQPEHAIAAAPSPCRVPLSAPRSGESHWPVCASVSSSVRWADRVTRVGALHGAWRGDRAHGEAPAALRGLRPALPLPAGSLACSRGPWRLELGGSGQEVGSAVDTTGVATVHGSEAAAWQLSTQPPSSCASLSYIMRCFLGGKSGGHM